MITCKFCGKTFPTTNHQVRCPGNPDRKMKVWTDDEKFQAMLKSKRTNKAYWTDDRRKEQSLRMQQVVAKNKDSYSKNNVSGRVKMYEVTSSDGSTKVKGKWELALAEWLNANNIRWTNNIEPYKYFWNNSWHLYFPDFHLVDLNLIVEVKGFETDRDRCKWQSVSDKQFKVVRKQDLADFNQIIRGHSGDRPVS